MMATTPGAAAGAPAAGLSDVEAGAAGWPPPHADRTQATE
jgi:hypothetical protein